MTCALVGCALVGCAKDAARTEAAGASSSDAPAASAAPLASVAAIAVSVSASQSAEAPKVAPAEDAFQRAKPLSGKSIGHTSVVFKLKLEGGLDAAYKPRSKVGKGRYRGEIAAYRLGTALGLPNVPPAYARAFDAASFRNAVGSEAIFVEVVPETDGTVRGAIIPWIKDLEFVALERDPFNARWHGWLAKGGTIAGDQKSVAAQISTMIVFDFVTGNWDRWSGGNVGRLAASDRILYIDNDGAFFDPAPAPALERQLGILQKVDRFSRAFVSALREVDVRAAVGDEIAGAPLLSAKVLEQVDARRKKALAIIDAKQKTSGDAETFFFE